MARRKKLKNGKFINKYRYLDLETIEVKLTHNKTFVTDAKHIDKINEHKLSALYKKDTNRYYVMYQDKKKKSTFTSKITNYNIVEYVDGNSLNCKLENLKQMGDITTSIVIMNNSKYNTKIDQYNTYKLFNTLFSFKFWTNSICMVPKNHWILGKVAGTIFERSTNDNIITVVIHDDNNDQHTKTFSIVNFFNKEKANDEALRWKYNTSYKLGMSKNMIRILDDEYIEVKLTKNLVMITDLVFLPLIQSIPLFSSKSANKNSKSYCSTIINNENLFFHNLITSYKMTDHFNHNPLDNRLINLQWTNFSENNRNRERADDTTGIRICTFKNANIKYYEVRGKYYGMEKMKSFRFNTEDEKIQAKKDAITFRKNIFEINCNDSKLEFTGKETYSDLSFLKSYLQLTKNNILNSTSPDVTKYLQHIDLHPDHKMLMFRKFLTIQYWRCKNLEIKLDIVKEQIKKLRTTSQYFVENNLPFCTNYEVTKYENCKDFKSFNHDESIKNNTFDIITQLTKYEIDQMVGIVKLKNGTIECKIQDLLRTDKIHLTSKNKHSFCLSYNEIMSDCKWCTNCNISKGETKIRELCSELFNEPFIKVRPVWLKNNNNISLELDLYNEDLKLAFEYNGQQHYEFIPLFHSTDEDFRKQKEHDEIKLKKCSEKGIQLIVIPYTIKLDDIKDYILEQLKKIKIKPTNIFFENSTEFDEPSILETIKAERIQLGLDNHIAKKR